VQVRTSPAVLEELYNIGSEAWRAVEDHQSPQALFWFYDWFLLVADVTLQIWNNNTQRPYSDALATRLALLIFEISQMTTKREYLGDIQKRLFEALVHVLLAFGKFPDLLDKVTSRAQETRNERVIGFVSDTIEAAREIDRKARNSLPGDEASFRPGSTSDS
jgi:hypothetical protein